MERKPITIYLDCFRKKPNNLYYKKIICRRKQIKSNSYTTNKNKEITVINSNTSLNKTNKNSKNIKVYQTEKDNKETNKTYNKSFISSLSSTQIKKQYNKIIKINYNINSIILIQKWIRGFMTRKKIKQLILFDKNSFIANMASSNHFQKLINMNIFEAIKKNSKKQKNSIKLANNKFNERSSVFSGSKSPWNRKHIIFINKRPKNIKSYSYDYKKNDPNDSKNYFQTDISEIPTVTNSKNKYNININKDINKNIDVNKKENNINKKENNISKKDNLCCMTEMELSMSNFFNEQLPQNINLDNTLKNINNDSINDKKINNRITNKNKSKEMSENHKRNYTNTEIESSIFYNCKTKKNKNSSEFKNPSHVSTFQTKENTSSDRIVTVENNNNAFNLDSPQKNTRKTTQVIFGSEKNDVCKKEEKKEKNNNLDTSIDHCLKDEFDSEANYIKNKKNFNLINTKNKYNFNPMLNTKLKMNVVNGEKKIIINKSSNNNSNNNSKSNSYYNSNNNSTKNSNNNSRCSLHVTTNNADLSNRKKNKKLCDIIKEEKYIDLDKQTDNDFNDLKSIKSSFYDDEDFVIINYDYTLNDKKKENTLKIISNVENININGRKNKINDFILAVKHIINKNIYRYVYNLFKKIYVINEKENYNDNDSEKSMTINDNISMVPEGRIEKNNIVFNYAQTEMGFNKTFNSINKNTSASNSNTNSHKILDNF